MNKAFALTLTFVVCLGCQSGGQRQSDSAFVSSAPDSAAATNNSNAVATGPAESNTGGGVTAVASKIGQIWNAVGFTRPEPAEPAPVSPEMARFNGFVNAITTQTSQLNINDPPEVTRQKAEGILTTLRDWDSVLAAGRSVGVINDTTAELLTSTVQHLTAETQKLIQYAPSQQTVDAVKQIGGKLGAVYSSVQGILAQGSTVSQALLGGQPQ